MNFSRTLERLPILPVLRIMISGHMKSEARAQKIFLDFSPRSQDITQVKEIMKLLQLLAP